MINEEKYELVKLLDIVQEAGEERTKEILSRFSCPKNPDIEDYLHDKDKAIRLAKEKVSPTHLVFTEYEGKKVLIGFFTITQKTITISSESKNFIKKLKRFGHCDEAQTTCSIPSTLIAQFGKNFSNNYNELIKGNELLKLALDKVQEAQSISGGGTVYIECENKQKLVDFYQENGFREFGRRHTDSEEEKLMDEKELIQMIKIF